LPEVCIGAAVIGTGSYSLIDGSAVRPLSRKLVAYHSVFWQKLLTPFCYQAV